VKNNWFLKPLLSHSTGTAYTLALKLPFVMIRKAGKLPGVLVSSGKYVTEYSTDETVMRLGSVKAGDRVAGRRTFHNAALHSSRR
jgi:hypothetical protein